jgi:hypothetical protein
VYLNFPALDLEDWAHAYYGTNYDRLVRVKKRYDLDDFFHFQQSLPSHHVPGRGAPTGRNLRSRVVTSVDGY